jgi:DNA polymerase-3 subunit beta
MKLIVKKDELKEKLGLIQNIVEKNGTMPILSHFLLDATSGKAIIMATDLTTSIREPLDATIEKQGVICIPARKLLEIVRESDSDITLHSSEAQWLTVQSGKSKFKLACLPHGEFPTWPAFEQQGALSFKGDELIAMIEKTLFCAGENDTRYTLNGLLFDLLPAKRLLAVVGTDGHRMAVATKEISCPGEARQLIFPRKAASDLLKLLSDGDDVAFAFGASHIAFRIGEIEFMARLIEGQYPNYEVVMPKSNDKTLSVDPACLSKAIRKTALVSKEGNKTLVFEVKAGTLIVSSAADEIGEAMDEIDIEYTGEPITFGFNSHYLLDAVSAFRSAKITISFLEKTAPVLLTNGTNNYRSIVMPIRLGNK